MVNILDVAERAGVSKSTVSRVINQPDTVKEALRLRVQQAIKELDYRPNLSARSLVSNRTNYISLIIPDIEPIFPVAHTRCGGYRQKVRLYRDRQQL